MKKRWYPTAPSVTLHGMTDVTLILEQVEAGQIGAREQLFEAVYSELRRMAAAQMAKEQPGQTLQPTALVHEAWLWLVKSPLSASTFSYEGKNDRRRYFFGVAAEAMRRIVVENARRKRSVRHGVQYQRQFLDEDQLPPEKSNELLAVHEALDLLAVHDPLKAELVKLRYFAGFTSDEAAELLGITPKSAEKQWVYARAWLKRHLSS
ncbi:MAG TPA: ECF-type sigma factor [Gemmatales bacterium]|nr:ECF-type sigma factor [Gemmatales bacterium]